MRPLDRLPSLDIAVRKIDHSENVDPESSQIERHFIPTVYSDGLKAKGLPQQELRFDEFTLGIKS
jgi:hypothetical protein